MLPNLDDVLPKLAGAKYFSKLDASIGFYQVPLHEDKWKLTTFITPLGRFCFKKVPFGITSAPEIFQHEMSTLLHGLKGTEVIMDDILIYGKTREEHNTRLKFQRGGQNVIQNDLRIEKVYRRVHGPRSWRSKTDMKNYCTSHTTKDTTTC